MSSHTENPPNKGTADVIAHASAAQIQQLVSVERVTLNVSQRVIVTTEDKLRLCLHNHISEIDRRKDWVAHFSVIVALSLALVSADFRDFIVPKDTWRAIFTIGSIITVGWLCVALRRAFSRRTAETLISEIKAEGDRVDE